MLSPAIPTLSPQFRRVRGLSGSAVKIISRKSVLARALATACIIAGLAYAGDALPGPFLIEGATIHGDQIAFGCGGQIWLVPREGGDATSISDSTSYDSLPCFSPDGSRLAFLRRSERVRDIYVRDMATGEVSRLTYHPANDFPVGWTPDSKRVLLNSAREGFGRLFTMGLDESLPAALSLPNAYTGAFSPDGKQIAYLPRSVEYHFIEEPYYRGGRRSPLWIAELESGTVTKITEGADNVRDPMWIGDRVYSLWDRDGRFDLYVYDVTAKETRKLTDLATTGLRNASTDNSFIVLVGDRGLQLFDLEDESVRPVPISIPRDESALRSRIMGAAGQVLSYSIGPDGARAVLCGRGDVLLVATASGTASNVTKTSGIAEREARISPDGRQVAYFSDATGEYVLHVRAVDSAEETPISIEPQPTFYSELTWSPDAKRIAFSDKRLTIWIADVEGGTTTKIDASASSAQHQFFLNWSPDGRCLAYAKHGADRLSRVYVHDTQTASNHAVTPDDCFATSPIFDKSGRYIYFISSPNAPAADFGWSLLSGVLSERLITKHLNAVVLRAGDPAPVLQAAPNLAVKWNDPAIAPIDFDGIEDRIVPIDAAPHYPTEIAAGGPGVIYIAAQEWPVTPGLVAEATGSLYRLDLRAPAEIKLVASLIQSFAVSDDGSTVLCRNGNEFRIATLQGPKVTSRPLSIPALPVPVVPADEWKQIAHEAWRQMRDLFYDPGHHGLDWEEVEQRYSEYLPSVRSREELNVLMRRMLGSVSVSHLSIGGGDIPTSLNENERVGLLGADLEIADGLYRFKRVLRSGHFDSADPLLRAPLAQPGAEVNDGEYLFAIYDELIDATRNIYEALAGKASMLVQLLVGPTPDRAKARIVQALLLSSEVSLRTADWARRNEAVVNELSAGKLGYFVVPVYSPSGIQDFFRGYFADRTKPGMIIDQRFNGGGITSDYFIEMLQRRSLYDYMFRDGDDLPVPVNARTGGPVVLLINEEDGSAAETFAIMFQLAKLGPIIGRTTGGGVIGPYGARVQPRLVDGGRVQIPSRAAFLPDGSWVENDGVHPDIEIDIMPQDWRAGRDPQLEAAVRAGLDSLGSAPPAQRVRPEYPEHP